MVSDELERILRWLRAGYPDGVPAHDFMPVLALLNRHLSEDEVRQVVAELERSGQNATRDDIGVRVTRLTDAVADPDDIARVERMLNSEHGAAPRESTTPQ